MKCFLHIGTEKTASTTIQNFMDINRQKLFKSGYIYPNLAGAYNSRALSVAAYNSDRRDDFTKQHGLDSEKKLLDFQKETINSLEKEIGKVHDNKTKIIFSSEHIQSRLTSIEEIQRLKKILTSLGASSFLVLVYLRRPADIANSLYSTSMKAGNRPKCPPSPKQPYWNNICNHKNTIEKFSSVFGESALIPKLFDKTEFKNGSIIDDFLNIIGIPLDCTYAIPENANKSLSYIGIHLLRNLNRTIPRWIDEKPNPLRANLVSYLGKHFSNSKYVMPKHLYKEYDLEFKESNEWVRKHYFPDKNTLFSEEVPIEAVQDITEKDIDRISEFIASIWNDKQKKILKLKRDKR